jgi:CheY-like chemotaxis protein
VQGRWSWWWKTSRYSWSGYEVIEVKDGSEALEVLEGKEPVDVLFCDVVLPGGMDGVELARAARARRPGLPVLFTSGYAHRFVLRLSGDLSDLGWLPKPFDVRSLSKKLQDVLG